MSQIVDWKFIKKVANMNLPYHEQYKSKDGYEFIKRERFIFDAFPKADTFEVFRVDRTDEFAPIKGAEGKDSPDSATLMYLRYLRKKNKQ